MNRRDFLTTGAIAAATLAMPMGAAAQDSVASGTFTGKSNHVTTGGVRIRKAGNEYFIDLATNFSFDGAPDPKVALGRNGYDPNTLLAPLAKNSGAQSYAIPAGINVSTYNEVWIWCEKFNVPLGVAALK